MIRAILARLHQGQRTLPFPAEAPKLPGRYRGRPLVDEAACASGCTACAEQCPTEAISIGREGVSVDLGRCLFCPVCAEVCPEDAITYSTDYRLAVRDRSHLVTSGTREIELAGALEREALRVFGRSLRLRQVSAGGCNACEADVNVLGTILYDMGRFGIQFVASPRHADGLLVTGPVTENMREALLKTYGAVPEPKLVIAVGACALSGGPFAGLPVQSDGLGALLDVDLLVPGCPPHPVTVLDGLLRLLGRLDA